MKMFFTLSLTLALMFLAGFAVLTVCQDPPCAVTPEERLNIAKLRRVGIDFTDADENTAPTSLAAADGSTATLRAYMDYKD